MTAASPDPTSSPPPPPEATKGNVLVVDDTLANVRLLEKILTHHGYKVRKVLNGKMALTAVQTTPPDLILLDINMPEMSGYEVCEHLKADQATADIPVIFISALGEAIDKVKAFNMGGVDYITKPFQLEEVLVRVENQLILRRMQLKLQQFNANLEDLVRQRTQALQQEIVKRQKAQAQLEHMAMHDSLTNLPNRVKLMQQLTQNLERAHQDSNYGFAVLFLDFDRFKLINDSLGHLVGDQLLIAVARRLEVCLTSMGLIGRLGGDEFLILLEDVVEVHQAICCAEQIQTALTQSFQLDRHEVFLNASIGIVLHRGYSKPEEVLRDADIAMYHAKSQGRGRYQVFEAEMHDRAVTRLWLETDLRRAIERQEFQVYYQPIVQLQTGQLAGVEALIRWEHPHRGRVGPGEFIPIAEETGMIIPIGEWVLREACRQAYQWQIQYPHQAPLSLSVNLSVRQFAQRDLIGSIDRILAETGFSSQQLKLEITESVVIENADQAHDILMQLKARQIQISIDDFGTGYSSLSYLHRFPSNILKIDRSFVGRLNEQGENIGIVRTILALAKNLDMEVIAEGIETPAQRDQLRQLGCRYGQGYLFARPLDSPTLEKLIATAYQWPLHEK